MKSPKIPLLEQKHIFFQKGRRLAKEKNKINTNKPKKINEIRKIPPPETKPIFFKRETLQHKKSLLLLG